MNLEYNKSVARRVFEDLVNQRNFSVLDTDFAADFVDHDAAPGMSVTKAGLREFFERLFLACPDLHVTVEDSVAEGDRVVVRTTWRGTHTGPMFGLPPTNARFAVKGIVIWRLKSGLLAERWGVTDLFSLRQQLAGEKAD